MDYGMPYGTVARGRAACKHSAEGENWAGIGQISSVSVKKVVK